LSASASPRRLGADSAPLRNAEVGHRHDPRRAIDGLAIESKHSFLDLGCGDGLHSRQLDERAVAQLVDCDIDLGTLATLQRARAAGPSAAPPAYVCADALRLPFARESFDRVICSLVLYLLPLDRALAGIFGLMRAGGRAYVRVPMLAASRARALLRGGEGLRARLYSALHVWNGLCFALLGRQIPNPLLRHDRWACYVPRGRFIASVRRAGFRLASLRIDYPRPGIPSIDAWIEKPL
jgi:SAM-dependent methyltransferase